MWEARMWDVVVIMVTVMIKRYHSPLSLLAQNKCQDRWPSIVMRITDRGNEVALLDGVVCFFDQQVSDLINFKFLYWSPHHHPFFCIYISSSITPLSLHSLFRSPFIFRPISGQLITIIVAIQTTLFLDMKQVSRKHCHTLH